MVVSTAENREVSWRAAFRATRELTLASSTTRTRRGAQENANHSDVPIHGGHLQARVLVVVLLVDVGGSIRVSRKS